MDPEQRKARIDSFIELQIAGVRSQGMRYFIGYDPVPALEKLSAIPVLAIFGEKDLQVPPRQNLPPMKAALERAGNPNAAFKVIAGANHLFQASKTGSPAEYATLEKQFTGNLPQIIADWIHALP